MREALAAEGEAATVPEAAQLGVFGDYELLAELGHGGMGVVYKARQRSLHRVVALKMLLGGQFAGKVALGRFRAEAELAAQLQHPNIVAIHEIGEQDGLPYFTMDFVSGRSLVDLVRDQPLPARSAAGYVQTIARAIHYAHQQGVLHRDLKPSNILIDSFDQPRITDFGLAKRLTGSTSDLTVSGQALGSPNFMPPEQAAGKHKTSGPTSDIYGLGAILYYLLTTRPPFLAEDASAAVRQVLENDPVSPRTLNPSVPRDLETLCLKCLQKDPKQRYASAQEVADELDRFLRGEPIQARPVSALTHAWRWCGRKPVLAAMAAVVIALAAISTTTAVRMTVAQEGRERERYRSNIQLAAAHIEKGDIDQALESLLQCPPHLRHWEWGFLVGECHREVLALDHARDPLTNAPLQLDGPEWKCGFSPDGQRVGTIHPSGIVQMWELPSGKPVWSLRSTNEADAGILWLPDWSGVVLARSNIVEIVPVANSSNRLHLAGHTYRVRRLAVSRDGIRIAALAADDFLRVWNLTSGQPLACFPVAAGAEQLRFTSDGRIVVATRDQAIVYDASSGSTLARMAGAPKGLRSVQTDPEAERFVTVSLDEHFRLWTTNGLIRDLGVMPNRWYHEVVFSPDRRVFCTSGIDATASIRDTQTGEILMTIPNRVDTAAFSPDGQRLATRGGTSIIQIWDLAKHRELLKLRGHREALHNVAFSPDGRLLASVSTVGSVKVWSALPGRELFNDVNIPWGLSHTLDGRLLAHSYLPGWTDIRDTRSGRLVARVRRLNRVVMCVAFSPDGRHLATGEGFGEITIWEVATGRQSHVLRGHGHYILSLVYSRDGRRLVSGSRDTTVCIWDTKSYELVRSSKVAGTLDISPDGRLMVATEGAVARIWNLETGQCERELREHKDNMLWAAFSSDGSRMVTGSDDRALRLWDARSGERLVGWKLRGICNCIAFSPDGKRAALRVTQSPCYATDAPTVELWDVETGSQLLAYRGFLELANTVGFSPDGRRLVTDWWDTKVRQWETFPWTEAEYPGSPAQPLRERMRLYADRYWRDRLEIEREAANTNETLVADIPFDRSRVPARDPHATPNLVDLTAHYTSTLNEGGYIDSTGDFMGIDLRNVPEGLVRFQDVSFDMRGVVQLTQNPGWVLWEDYPQAIEQIPVAQRFQKLHAIIGTIGSAPEGKAIGALVLHYADGTRHECEILYGRHVRDWWTHNDSRTDTDLAQVAWEGPHAFPKIHPTRLRIYHSTWENPRPDAEVVSFDFVSKMTTTAAPFLIAVTVE